MVNGENNIFGSGLTTIADRKKFGKFVRERREQAGFDSQAALSRASGVSAPTIFRIEEGKTTEPGLETLKKLAGPLNTSYEELITKAGFLPDRADSDKGSKGVLLAPRGAIRGDLTEGLTVDEIEQMKQYRSFLIMQRGK